MRDGWNELRYAVRVLAASPGFTTVAIVSLALAIGVNTTVLGVARAVLLQPLAVDRPDQLRLLYWDSEKGARGVMQYNSTGTKDERTGRSVASNFSHPAYLAMRAAVPQPIGAFSFLRAANISIENQPVVGGGMLVSGNYFGVMGVPMAAGRGLTDDDDRDAAEPAVVLSYALWQRAYGGDPAALGRTIRVNASPFTIVGVAGRGYFGVSNGGFFPPADVTLPLHALARVMPQWRDLAFFSSEKTFWLHLLSRVDDPRADARMQEVLSATFAAQPGTAAVKIEKPRIVVLPGARGIDAMARTFATPIAILAGVAALVFLIACVNVAGLVLARGLARQREYWIRAALGAGRGRLVRQIFTESALLAVAGGALGLVLCAWGAPALVTMVAGAQATAIDVSLDWRLALTSAAIALAAAVLFGVMPAVRIAATSTGAEFARQRGVGAERRRPRASAVLIAVQIAVSIPLLAGSALFLRTIHNLAAVDLGFDAKNLIVFRLDPALNHYDDARSRRLFDDVLARLQAEPGVRSATLMENGLVAGLVSSTGMKVDGSTESKQVLFNRVGPGYFEALGIRIVAGRGLGVQDRPGTPRVAVVNETAVREFFGGGLPLGRHVRMLSFAFLGDEPIEVVGVARDSKYSSVKTAARPTIFLPFLQGGALRSSTVAVRTDGTGDLPRRIRAAVAAIDRDVPVTDLKLEETQIEESIGSERMFTTLLVFFGGFALLLACIGLHGITSHAVARRTSEIGVRLALGARQRQVLWLILRQVIVLAAVGLALGIPAAIAASRSVRALLYGVEPADPRSLALGSAAMLAVAVASGFLPARRAAALDPLVALRRE